ncbi:hypothetical protein ALC62_13827 [Cyphomyrmex costatus]|uniref:Uncharacterized protein n=1 Tax=Cyphomyrmex costatus TaxID=456900 RepID=A0A195C3F7_9HYME|nr:hypothetical protein ALC62_13827 [Cyphomyrmex costatus]
MTVGSARAPVVGLHTNPLDIPQPSQRDTRMQIHLDMHFNTNYGDASFSKTLWLNQRRAVMMLPIAPFSCNQYV